MANQSPRGKPSRSSTHAVLMTQEGIGLDELGFYMMVDAQFVDIILKAFEKNMCFMDRKTPPSRIKQWHKRDTAGP